MENAPQLYIKPSESNTETKNIYIFLKFSTESQNLIKNNLLKVLQKTGTTIKTKMLHQIIDQNKIKFVLGIIDPLTNESKMAQYSLSGDKLNGFYLNIFELMEPEDKQLLITYNDLQKEILQTKTRITDNNDYVVAKLLENQITLEKEIVNSMNFFKAVDIIFFEYLQLLGALTKQKFNIFKILESTASVLSKVLNNLIQKLGGNNPEVAIITQKLMLLYMIMHYSNESDTNIKIFLFKSGIITKDEYDNFNVLVKTKTMEDISKHLIQAQIINISPNSLRNNFKNIIGEKGLQYLEGNKVENIIAYLVLNKNQNMLYNTYLNSPVYKDSITHLETLLLNVKSSISL